MASNRVSIFQIGSFLFLIHALINAAPAQAQTTASPTSPALSCPAFSEPAIVLHPVGVTIKADDFVNAAAAVYADARGLLSQFSQTASTPVTLPIRELDLAIGIGQQTARLREAFALRASPIVDFLRGGYMTWSLRFGEGSRLYGMVAPTVERAPSGRARGLISSPAPDARMVGLAIVVNLRDSVDGVESYDALREALARMALAVRASEDSALMQAELPRLEGMDDGADPIELFTQIERNNGMQLVLPLRVNPRRVSHRQFMQMIVAMMLGDSAPVN